MAVNSTLIIRARLSISAAVSLSVCPDGRLPFVLFTAHTVCLVSSFLLVVVFKLGQRLALVF